MKTQKGLAVLATVSLLGLSVACNDRYQEGFNAGKDQGYRLGYDRGYDDGYADGDEAGFERARVYFAGADYNAGFAAGRAEGISIGFNQGFTAGRTEGYNLGYNTGYTSGRTAGISIGYDMGYDDGLADGYDMGYDDGLADGYDFGYDDGFADGYDIGYDDGWYDAWGLSVGKSKALKGYSNLLSMVHNDLFDYSKIKAPKQTSRGLTVNGNMLFEETSLTSKDTLKRAAVVEQYLVVEMAKQVQGKFGLSAERSFKIAKASNHFRKYSSKRALTADDTNAYAQEIIGADIKTIERAYERSMKGDVSGLQTVIEKAALKNETSPEKMAEIVSSLFM
jgi:flagellar biosynthesis/type III secretory pathway protein FliH